MNDVAKQYLLDLTLRYKLFLFFIGKSKNVKIVYCLLFIIMMISTPTANQTLSLPPTAFVLNLNIFRTRLQE